MIKNEKWIILGVYALFLLVLSKIGGEGIEFYYSRYEPLSDRWLWWIALAAFVIGAKGLRKGTTIDGNTMDGTRFTAFLDQGSFEGTGGIVGGVSLSLAYITAFIIGARITQGKELFDSLYAIAAIMILILPFYLILLFVLQFKNVIGWAIGIGWLIFVLTMVKP